MEGLLKVRLGWARYLEREKLRIISNQESSTGVMRSRKHPVQSAPFLSPGKVLNKKEDFAAVTENTGLVRTAMPALIDS